MSERTCKLCGHALPEKPRDPPLPPLEKPALITIHDVGPGAKVEEIKAQLGYSVRKLVVEK